jgi:hypothetical protein
MKSAGYASSGGELKKENRILWSCLQSVLNSTGFKGAHRRELGDDNGDGRYAVDNEIRQVVMGEMGAAQEQQYGHAEQELLRGRVLVAVVNLLPHVEVVVCARVEVKGHAAHVVEHEVGEADICEVDEGPRCLLRDAGHDVEQDLAEHDEDDVDCPCAWGVSCILAWHMSSAHPWHSPTAHSGWAGPTGR